MYRNPTPWAVRPLLLVTAACLSATAAPAQQADVSPAAFGGCLPLRPRWSQPPSPYCPAPPGAPATPWTPGTPGTPSTPGMPPTPPNAAAPPTVDTGDTGGRGGALATASLALPSPGGYLDNAAVQSMFRLRYDYMFNFNRPDRAEFFLAGWREISFHPHGVVDESRTFQSAQGKGLDPLPGKINLEDVSVYLELAKTNHWSVFAEMPFRMIYLVNQFSDNDKGAFPEPGGVDPHETREQAQTNSGGLSDVVFGVKYAMVAEEGCNLTFQLRGFFPSGDSRLGLGTGHYSIEPGLLYARRVDDRLSFQSELKLWIPIDSTTSIIDGRRWAGGVITYGGGLGYDVIQRQNLRITPLVELVGWVVTNGLETVFSPDHSPLNVIAGVPQDHAVASAAITSILNLKLGVRTYIGQNDDFYIGFGQALTPERWYNQIVRAEYRRSW